ncbi:HI1506-related protein [Pseudomonas citronellolis]|uniref:HI1506-related protein n=1 Tax=Pseudomonas citronellolis TaxID=53408 RepID=UPI0023E390F5|nr:HI1506-related protein [Pseudomonas citronellolis]MDF3931391.1 HI1506-related protein [Pseudomonas citronellolis]
MIVRIKANRPVYRRLGIVFGKQAIDFADDRFTEAELQTLQADPVLLVKLVDGELVADACQSGGEEQPPAGGSASAEPSAAPTADTAKAVKAPAKAAAKGKGGAKAGAPKAKGPAKAAGKPAAQATQDEPPADDSANAAAKDDAAGDGGTGQE